MMGLVFKCKGCPRVYKENVDRCGDCGCDLIPQMTPPRYYVPGKPGGGILDIFNEMRRNRAVAPEINTLPLVYVAGPYRAETREAVAQNVAAARHVGRLCVMKGWVPLMPTVNTAMFDHDFPSLGDDQFWLNATMEMMRRCDAVVLVDGWQYSAGAKGEIDEAYRLGIKVYNSAGELPVREVA